MAGWPDQARSRVRQGLDRAKDLGHPLSLSLALVDAAHVQLWCGDLDEAERLAVEGERVAHAYDVALYAILGNIVKVYIRVQRGKPAAQLSMLTEGLAQYRSMGARYLLPLYLSWLADTYQRVDHVDEGLATVVEALHMTETNFDVFWEAELYRLKGELTLKQFGVRSQNTSRQVKTGRNKVGITNPQPPIPNPQLEAEACFLKAIEIARQQGAKSLELRAATSLARLWQQQGKQDAACDTLSTIYSWFTEGFDTKDLREAKAVLDALSV